MLDIADIYVMDHGARSRVPSPIVPAHDVDRIVRPVSISFGIAAPDDDNPARLAMAALLDGALVLGSESSGTPRELSLTCSEWSDGLAAAAHDLSESGFLSAGGGGCRDVLVIDSVQFTERLVTVADRTALVMCFPDAALSACNVMPDLVAFPPQEPSGSDEGLHGLLVSSGYVPCGPGSTLVKSVM